MVLNFFGVFCYIRQILLFQPWNDFHQIDNLYYQIVIILARINKEVNNKKYIKHLHI